MTIDPKLSEFCAGKTVIAIYWDEMDYITIVFSDLSKAVLSTLGGIEVYKLNEPNRKSD